MSRFDPDVGHPDDEAERDSLDEAYLLALERDSEASIADELESAANCFLHPDPNGGTRFERRLRFAIRDAVNALRQRGWGE